MVKEKKTDSTNSSKSTSKKFNSSFNILIVTQIITIFIVIGLLINYYSKISDPEKVLSKNSSPKVGQALASYTFDGQIKEVSQSQLDEQTSLITKNLKKEDALRIKKPEGQKQVLENIILTDLILNAAKKLKVQDRPSYQEAFKTLADELLRKTYLNQDIFSKIKVSKKLVSEFYDKEKDNLFSIPPGILFTLFRGKQIDILTITDKLKTQSADQIVNEYENSSKVSLYNYMIHKGQKADGISEDIQERILQLKPDQFLVINNKDDEYLLFLARKEIPRSHRPLEEIRKQVKQAYVTQMKNQELEKLKNRLFTEQQVKINFELPKSETENAQH